MKSSDLAKIKRMQADPAKFRAALRIDADGRVVPLSKVLDPWQRQDFEAIDSGWRAVAGHKVTNPTLRAWLERGRGHSKTSDVATMVVWILLASQRQLSGVCAAADADQAGLIHDAISRLVRLNAWLQSILDVQARKVINKHTDSELTIISSDVESSWGLLVDFIVCDELTHWKKRDLWDSLFSAAGKKSNCLLCVIGNAGFADSWQWSTREAIRTDPRWHFSRLEGPQASWITRDRLDEQRRLLPSIAFNRI